MLGKLKDPVSSLTHLLGAILSVIGLILLIVKSVNYGTMWHLVVFIVFGVSLILLYTASSVYHALNISENVTRILRKIDHMMIFVLIAGTYTPISLIPLRGPWGWSIFGSVWGIAVLGILMKLFWINAPRWLSTLIYTFMGWLIVIAFWPLIKTVPIYGILWLAAGGLFYTFGAVVYGLKWPRLNWKVFGFHEIFHVFVLLGSFSHFWVMYQYILYL